MTTHTIPLLQGTCRKLYMPIRKSDLRQEPFRPSRSNAGLGDSANMIDKRVENKDRQCLTRGHKTLGAKWLYEPRYSHQSFLCFDSKVAPKSPMFHTAIRCK